MRISSTIRQDLGSIFLILGSLVTLNASNSITGFVIFQNILARTGYIIGLWFIASGIVLLTSARLDHNKYRIQRVVDQYERGNLNPVQAVEKIMFDLHSGVHEPIRRVTSNTTEHHYRFEPIPRPGLEIIGGTYKGNNNQTISLQLRDGNREDSVSVKFKDGESSYRFMQAAYELADDQYGSNFEIHHSKQISTKHHTAGFKKSMNHFSEKYAHDLEFAKRRAA